MRVFLESRKSYGISVKKRKFGGRFESPKINVFPARVLIICMIMKKADSGSFFSPSVTRVDIYSQSAKQLVSCPVSIFYIRQQFNSCSPLKYFKQVLWTFSIKGWGINKSKKSRKNFNCWVKQFLNKGNGGYNNGRKLRNPILHLL